MTLKRPALAGILASLAVALLFGQAHSAIIEQVGVDAQVFSPAKGESVAVRYTLAQPARVTVAMHDPDGRVIRTLASSQSRPAGLHVLVWDGKDEQGRVVPDEAYYPTFRAETEAGAVETQDPTRDSGGEMIAGIEAQYDAARQRVRYVLPQTARVRVLAGVDDGPMLNTLVANEPRVAGLCEEPWDGMDSSGAIKVTDQKGWRLRIDAFLLPKWSVVARGNQGTSFVQYTLSAMSKDKGLPPGYQLVSLERSPRPVGETKLSPFASQSRILDQPPRFTVSLKGKSGVARGGSDSMPAGVEVEVALEPLSAALLNEVRFEVVYYIDNQRMGEEEQGYTPMRFMLPTRGLQPGTHWLTVNVASLTGQLGSRTVPIEIE